MAYEIAFTKLFDTSALVTSGLIWHVDAGNVASYPGTGTVWTDLSPTAVNGTLNGGVGYTAADGGALTFDAFNDYSNTPYALSSTSGTIALWVRPTSLATRLCAFVNYDGSPNTSWSQQLGTGATAKVEGMIFDGGTKNCAGTTTLSANTWYYITMIWVDGVALSVYLNEGASVEGSVAMGTSWTGGTAFRVGNGSGGGWQMWDGRIAACHIYNRALSTPERAQNFNATKTRFGY